MIQSDSANLLLLHRGALLFHRGALLRELLLAGSLLGLIRTGLVEARGLLLEHLVALLLRLLRLLLHLVLSLGGWGRRLSGREASRTDSEGNADHQRNDLLHVVSPP